VVLQNWAPNCILCRKGRSRWSLTCWDYGFESRRGNGYLSCCVLSGRGLWDGPITRPGGVLPALVCLKAGITPGYFTRHSPDQLSSPLVHHSTFRDVLNNFSVLPQGTYRPYKLHWVKFTSRIVYQPSEWGVSWTDFNCTLSNLVASEFKSC